MSKEEISPQKQLLLAAKRLLGGSSKKSLSSSLSSSSPATPATPATTSTTSTSSNSTVQAVQAATTMIHSNLSKIVKRWLGTSSGVSGSGKITLGDISTMAQTLLDPAGLCATGRDILVQLAPPSPSLSPSSSSLEQMDPLWRLVKLMEMMVEIMRKKKRRGNNMDTLRHHVGSWRPTSSHSPYTFSGPKAVHPFPRCWTYPSRAFR